MKIYSKWQDYYDHVRVYGIDPTLVYARHEREFFLPTLKNKIEDGKSEESKSVFRNYGEIGSGVSSAYSLTASSNTRTWSTTTQLIGFCGKPYPVIEMTTPSGVEYIYDPARARSLFPPPKNWVNLSKRDRKRRKSYGEELAAFLNSKFQIDEKVFIEINAPIFIIGRGQKGIANCSLKKLQFYRVMDPTIAFQEISMFIGNYLVKRDECSTVPDEYLIAEHGYDEHSFRHPVKISQLK